MKIEFITKNDLLGLLSRHPIELDCYFCNKKFIKSKNKVLSAIKNIQKNRLKFCSRKCCADNLITSSIFNCKHCNKEITRTKSQIKKSKTGNLFCSHSCNATYMALTNYIPKLKPQGNCFVCKTSISKNKKYCKSCFTLSTKDWNKVTLNTLLLYLSKTKAKQKIRENARTTYNSSGNPKHCILCNYKKHYDVCHLKPVFSFNASTPLTEINNINNLIALCKNHHWELDHNLMSDEDKLNLKFQISKLQIDWCDRVDSNYR